MDDQAVFSFDDGSLTVETAPTISYKNLFQFCQDGRVVGSVDATFDFSKMPPSLHTEALDFMTRFGMIQRRVTIELPRTKPRTNASSKKAGGVKSKKKPKFFSRLFRKAHK